MEGIHLAAMQPYLRQEGLPVAVEAAVEQAQAVEAEVEVLLEEVVVEEAAEEEEAAVAAVAAVAALRYCGSSW